MTQSFPAVLFRWGEGKGSWYFAPIPEELAPPVTEGWGRTPVTATVDGQTWETSTWRGKDGRTLLAVPKKVRGSKGDGDEVEVAIEFKGRRAARTFQPPTVHRRKFIPPSPPRGPASEVNTTRPSARTESASP